MKGTIAVEGVLSNVAQELKTYGYDVVDVDNNLHQDLKAVVVSGEDVNIMNMSNIKVEVPVIDARGKTAVQVRQEIEKY